jgi:hypothetical protein
MQVHSSTFKPVTGTDASPVSILVQNSIGFKPANDDPTLPIEKTASLFSRALANILIWFNQFSFNKQKRTLYQELSQAVRGEGYLQALPQAQEFSHNKFLEAREALINLAWHIPTKEKYDTLNKINVLQAERLTEAIEWKAKDADNQKSFTNVARLYHPQLDEGRARNLEDFLSPYFKEMQTHFYTFRQEVLAHQQDYRRVWAGVENDEKLNKARDNLLNLWDKIFKDADTKHVDLLSNLFTGKRR